MNLINFEYNLTTQTSVHSDHCMIPVCENTSLEQMFTKLVMLQLASYQTHNIRFQHTPSHCKYTDGLTFKNRFNNEVKTLFLATGTVTDFCFKKLSRKTHFVPCGLTGGAQIDDHQFISITMVEGNLNGWDLGHKQRMDCYLENDELDIVLNQSLYLKCKLNNLPKLTEHLKSIDLAIAC